MGTGPVRLSEMGMLWPLPLLSFPGVVGPWCVRNHGEPCEQFRFQVPASGTCWSLGQLLLPDHTPMRLVLTATGPALVEKVQVPSHQLMGEPIVDALPLRIR